MKKIFLVVLMFILVFAIVFFSIPNNVQAGFVSSSQCLAAGTWNTGTQVEVDLTSAPAPEWLHLLTTNGVVIKEPTQLCHELGGGKFHWVGEIRKLVGERWIKLETTTHWFPDEEGVLMACAQAPSAGTYALFAYYNGPQEYFYATETPTPTCGINEEYVGGLCECKQGYSRTNGDICTIIPTKLK